MFPLNFFHLGFYEEKSPLLDIHVNLVDDVVVDPMHQVYGGVCKLLLQFLIRVWEHRVTKQFEKQINNRLLRCKRFWPNDFQRKPEVLSEVGKWKCTQYRFFLLYLGPIVLKGVVSPLLYVSTYGHSNFVLQRLG